MDQIRRDKPEEQTGLSRERRIVKSEDKTEAPPQDASQLDSQLTQVHDSEMDEEVDKVVITPDLMCSICERPDDEENMLAHIGNVKELLQQEMQLKMQEDGELEEEGQTIPEEGTPPVQYILSLIHI